VASRLLENAWTPVSSYTCLADEAGCLEHSVTSQKMISAGLEVVPNPTLSYCKWIFLFQSHTNLPCSIFGPAAAFFPPAFWYKLEYFFS